MAGKLSDASGSPASKSGPTPFLELGKERTEAMTTLQKELLEAYEQTSSAWLARVKSEVDLWSGLATKLTATRSAPEAMEAYRDCVAQRMQMAAEDGRRMSEDCQKVMQKITRSFSNGWPTGSK
jgi:Phasin protein